MVANLMTNTPARDAFNNAVQAITGRVTLTAADTPVVKIGTIPAGAFILVIASRIVTLFAGGTPVLGIGSVAAGGTTPAVGGTGNVVIAMAETAVGGELVQALGTLAMPFTVDTDIYAGTSGAATSGDAIITVLFVKPLS